MIQPRTAVQAVGKGLTNGLGVSVRGLGHYLPHNQITNDDLSRMVDTSDEWILPRTGIRSRHIAAPDQATSDLAAAAGSRALADACMDSKRFDAFFRLALGCEFVNFCERGQGDGPAFWDDFFPRFHRFPDSEEDVVANEP